MHGRAPSEPTTESVKRGPPVSKLPLIEQSGSADGTATEHLDRSIEVIYLRAAHVLPILSYLPVSRYSPRREYHKSAGTGCMPISSPPEVTQP
eukprot:2153995-Pyramimonas_sp.AAC.1